MPDDPYNPELLNFQKSFAENLPTPKEIPPPTSFDPKLFPFGKATGDNKLNLKLCPTCKKPPTNLSKTEHANAFPQGAYLFRDELSAKEFYISGMCQEYQDETFKIEDECEIYP